MLPVTSFSTSDENHDILLFKKIRIIYIHIVLYFNIHKTQIVQMINVIILPQIAIFILPFQEIIENK